MSRPAGTVSLITGFSATLGPVFSIVIVYVQRVAGVGLGRGYGLGHHQVGLGQRVADLGQGETVRTCRGSDHDPGNGLVRRVDPEELGPVRCQSPRRSRYRNRPAQPGQEVGAVEEVRLERERAEAACCISKPNVASGFEKLRVRDVAPAPVSRTLGVALSVLGGEPQLFQPTGTVWAVIAEEKVTVAAASESVVVVAPSAIVIGSKVVLPV